MKILYETPDKLWERLRRQENDIKIAEKACDEAYKVRNALVDALQESYDRIAKGLPVGVTVDPVCKTCNDSHKMPLGDREVLCTFCPVPCWECRGTLSAYCAHAPCPCMCHKSLKDCPTCNGGICSDCNWVGHLECKIASCKCHKKGNSK